MRADKIVAHRQIFEVAPQWDLLFRLGFERFHDQGFLFGRADIGTVTTAITVEGVNLNAEIIVFQILADGLFGLKTLRSIPNSSSVKSTGRMVAWGQTMAH